MKLRNEEQIEGLRGDDQSGDEQEQKQEEQQPDPSSGIEMVDDFDAEMNEVPRDSDGNGENDDDDGDEVDEQMG